MVFIDNFAVDFYPRLKNQDVDALCACKILQHLLQCDQIPYSLVPVSCITDVEQGYIEYGQAIKHVIFINCCATLPLVEMLQPPEDVTFYICDSHRPVDVQNIYDLVQVKLIIHKDEAGDRPSFDEVFREDDSSDDENASEQPSRASRLDPDKIERRMNRRIWQQKRDKILFEYTQFARHGSSVAFTLFKMAWKMGRDSNDLLWMAIVGATSQLVNYRISWDKYFDNVMDLQHHVTRHNHARESDDNVLSVDCAKIHYEEELWLCLYRHWSLMESICHSVVPACMFRVWTLKGRKRLHEFFADMGIPLTQCEQKFSSMESGFRKNIRALIQSHAEKFGFDLRDLFIPSFTVQHGFRNQHCAADLVYACSALLEQPPSKETDTNAASSEALFLNALDALDRKKPEALNLGLDLARRQMHVIQEQVHSFLDLGQILSAGPFLYGFIDDGTHPSTQFSNPICLHRLARFTLEAHCASGSARNKAKWRSVPLVLGCATKRFANSTQNGLPATLIIIGIAPLCEDRARNFFGKAFEQAAIASRARIMQDSFDTHMIQIAAEDRTRFLDALINVLL